MSKGQFGVSIANNVMDPTHSEREKRGLKLASTDTNGNVEKEYKSCNES
jgi:hypothetical protein